MRAYLKAIDRQKRADLIDMMNITRAAGADKDAYKAILRDLNNG